LLITLSAAPSLRPEAAEKRFELVLPDAFEREPHHDDADDIVLVVPAVNRGADIAPAAAVDGKDGDSLLGRIV
jgi:hypothetical protein